MRSFGFMPKFFLGSLRLIRMGGIDLGKQILIFPAVKIILQSKGIYAASRDFHLFCKILGLFEQRFLNRDSGLDGLHFFHTILSTNNITNLNIMGNTKSQMIGAILLSGEFVQSVRSYLFDVAPKMFPIFEKRRDSRPYSWPINHFHKGR